MVIKEMISDPDKLSIWTQLKQHNTNDQFQRFIQSNYFDCSIHHHRLNLQVLHQLEQLSLTQGLNEAKEKWLIGDETPNMPKYIFLRAFKNTKLPSSKQDIVDAERKKIKEYAEKIRTKSWLGYTGQPITDIVNIGMGGSDLGPRLCIEALEGFKTTPLKFYFISDADYFSFQKVSKNLNPETTLFLVSSKSFTTEETLLNAKLAIEWLNHPQAIQKNFIAITAFPEKARTLGFVNILKIWDWVIGRYSCCSAINLITSIMLGYEGFEQFLKGAHAMDMHFLTEELSQNIPMLMALIGIWNINFLKIPSHLLLIYNSKLRLFVDYLQQLDMESNGKSVNTLGKKINYPTGPIIWGGLGNQAQHSYYQHLTQSHQQIAIDFLNVNEPHNQLLNKFCYERKTILKKGFSADSEKFAIKRQIAINHIQLHLLNPESLGALIALYEHKIFSQAWIWNINPFDQPGVEAAKQKYQILQSSN